MATREENLKKINAELEQLSDEELEAVAGGTRVEVANDSKFLNDMGFMDKSYTNVNTIFGWGDVSKAVDAGWSKAGVECVTKFLGKDLYFVNGQEISRNQAYRIAAEKAGKTFNPNDYALLS